MHKKCLKLTCTMYLFMLLLGSSDSDWIVMRGLNHMTRFIFVLLYYKRDRNLISAVSNWHLTGAVMALNSVCCPERKTLNL